MAWHALLGGAVLLVIVVGPIAYAVAPARPRDQVRPTTAPADSGWPWRLVAGSTLQCVIAFNLVFLIQEILLVVPKALTPGLRPTLFHNNHTWQGTAPIADLFQGTGAVGLLMLSCGLAVGARRRPPRSVLGRLLMIWIAYQGMFQALPQFVVAGFGEGDHCRSSSGGHVFHAPGPKLGRGRGGRRNRPGAVAVRAPRRRGAGAAGDTADRAVPCLAS
jgi:hypothetical protein